MRMFASLPGGGVVADPPTMKITLHKLYEDLWGEGGGICQAKKSKTFPFPDDGTFLLSPFYLFWQRVVVKENNIDIICQG